MKKPAAMKKEVKAIRGEERKRLHSIAYKREEYRCMKPDMENDEVRARAKAASKRYLEYLDAQVDR